MNTFFFLEDQESLKDKNKIVNLLSESKKSYYSMDTYVLNLKFTLYNSPTSNDISEQYTGVAVKKGNSFYTKVDKSEFIKSQNLNIRIDNEEKLIQIDKSAEKYQLPLDQLEEMLPYFNKFEVKENSNTITCTLKAPEVTFIPYGKIIFLYDKKQRKITKQVFYLLHQMETKNSKGEKKVSNPRLEIESNQKNSDIKLYLEKLNTKNYFYLNGKKRVLSKKYKSYKIVE